MSNNIDNGARNYSISQTPLNNSGFDVAKANPMKPATAGSGSMFSLGRQSAIRIRPDGFKEVIENNKYSGAKSSSERTQYLKKLAQGSTRPTTTSVSYVSNENTNRNDINSAKRRARNTGSVVPKKVGL